LNKATISDAYLIPRIDEHLEKFSNAKWFSSLDLAAGYNQVLIAKKDIEKTAFTCSRGLFEYIVMLFGLMNAPAIFQRLMDKVYINKFVIVYIDDIMIYSETFEEHLEYIRAGLILKLKKCVVCEKEIEFLGHNWGRRNQTRSKEDRKDQEIGTTKGCERSKISVGIVFIL
jgi:hypothetical protein